MALSCYSNLEELEAYLNSEMSIFADQPLTNEQLLPPELLEFDSNNFSFSSDSLVWDYSHELFYSNNCLHSSLPNNNYISTPTENPYYSLLPEIFPSHDDEYDQTCPYLKRQKVYDQENFLINSDIIMPGLCNDFNFVPNPCLFQEPAFPQYRAASYKAHVDEAPKNPSSGGRGTLSAQSMAARQRRRKITEKTQELGKLIPGGHKMNTAEMFQAAFKYIKFLQAQVGVLETMSSSICQENGDSFNDNPEMELLFGSSLIQEKLYTAEKCLVPKELVESLPNHQKLNLDIYQSSLDVKQVL